MKKVLILITMLASSIAMNAQSLEDVVYLKNGSIIHGIIIEQVPGQSLKIKTRDGNVFVYQFSEVEKFTKEEPVTTTNRAPKTTNYSTTEHQWCKKGYRGFVETGTSVSDDDVYMNFITTSHGVQINPNIFVGGGIGFEYAFDNECFQMPVFANFRYNILRTRFTPFVDTKVGFSTCDDEVGAFFTVAAGAHVSFTPKFGLYASVGYELRPEGYWFNYYGEYANCFGVRLGIDF